MAMPERIADGEAAMPLAAFRITVLHGSEPSCIPALDLDVPTVDVDSRHVSRAIGRASHRRDEPGRDDVCDLKTGVVLAVSEGPRIVNVGDMHDPPQNDYDHPKVAVGVAV